MNELHIDSEFESLIPPLSSEEFGQLKNNILADGCRDALVVWDGTIVDGHNRYKICTDNNISFKLDDRDFHDCETVIEFIIRNQFGRRNLSAGNRSILG